MAIQQGKNVKLLQKICTLVGMVSLLCGEIILPETFSLKRLPRCCTRSKRNKFISDEKPSQSIRRTDMESLCRSNLFSDDEKMVKCMRTNRTFQEAFNLFVNTNEILNNFDRGGESTSNFAIVFTVAWAELLGARISILTEVSNRLERTHYIFGKKNKETVNRKLRFVMAGLKTTIGKSVKKFEFGEQRESPSFQPKTIGFDNALYGYESDDEEEVSDTNESNTSKRECYIYRKFRLFLQKIKPTTSSRSVKRFESSEQRESPSFQPQIINLDDASCDDVLKVQNIDVTSQTFEFGQESDTDTDEFGTTSNSDIVSDTDADEFSSRESE